LALAHVPKIKSFSSIPLSMLFNVTDELVTRSPYLLNRHLFLLTSNVSNASCKLI
jgi:hypothetical protein